MVWGWAVAGGWLEVNSLGAFDDAPGIDPGCLGCSAVGRGCAWAGTGRPTCDWVGIPGWAVVNTGLAGKLGGIPGLSDMGTLF